MLESRKVVLALVVSVLQFQAIHVTSERTSIRGEYKRPDRDRIGSSYNREERPVVGSNNNNSLGNDVESSATLNLVLVPECNPDKSNSLYSLSKKEENKDNTDYLEDSLNDCEQYLQFCDKKRSNVDMSWPNYVHRDEFYKQVELLYSQCFKSCVDYLPGGVEEFCSMPEPQDKVSAEYTSASAGNDYCRSVGDSEWTSEMIAHEAAVLEALNLERSDPGGKVCTRRSNGGTTQTFFPRSSPVTTNDSLRCAARIQAKNIVKTTIELGNRFPPNLHTACPNTDFGGGAPVCQDFVTRMTNSGYTYQETGFGRVSEVTAVGYRAPEAVIQGWLGSKSGHCSAVLKQESLVVTTEVGIGYYRDEETGMTGHVMLLGQRQL